MVNRDRDFLERHFSHPRLTSYLTTAGGDSARAEATYGWNAELAASFWAPLGHLEVALRNAIDARMSARQVALGRRGLVSQRQRFLWPDVASAFPYAPNRAQPTVHDPVARLREFGTASAHHHRIWSAEPAERYEDIPVLAGYLGPELRRWIEHWSTVRKVLDRRP